MDKNLDCVDEENNLIIPASNFIPDSMEITIPRTLSPNRLLICKIVNKGVTGWRHPYANRLLTLHSSSTLYFEFAQNGSATLTGPLGKKIWKTFDLFLDPTVETSIINFHFDGFDLGQNYQLVQLFSHYRKQVKWLTLDLQDWLMVWSARSVSIQNLLKIFAPRMKSLCIKSLPQVWQDNITLMISSSSSSTGCDDKLSSTQYPLPPAAKLTHLKELECGLKVFENNNYILKNIMRSTVQLQTLNLNCGSKQQQAKILQMDSFNPYLTVKNDQVLCANILKASQIKSLTLDPEKGGLLGYEFVGLCEPKLRSLRVKFSWGYGTLKFIMKTPSILLRSILEGCRGSLEDGKFEIAHLQFPSILSDLPNLTKLRRLELCFLIKGNQDKEKGETMKNGRRKEFIEFSTKKFPLLNYFILGSCPNVGNETELPIFGGLHDRVKLLTLDSGWIVHEEWMEKLERIFPSVNKIKIIVEEGSKRMGDLDNVVKVFKEVERLEVKGGIGPGVDKVALRAAAFIGESIQWRKQEGESVVQEEEKEGGMWVDFDTIEKTAKEDENLVEELNKWLFTSASIPWSFLVKPRIPGRIPITIYACGESGMEKAAILFRKFGRIDEEKRKPKMFLGEK